MTCDSGNKATRNARIWNECSSRQGGNIYQQHRAAAAAGSNGAQRGRKAE